MRREMKQQRRDAVELQPDLMQSIDDSLQSIDDSLQSIDVSSVMQSAAALKEISIAESSPASESLVTHAVLLDAAVQPPPSQHRSTVAKNRQKQLQEWSAARPTVPITSFYFKPLDEAQSLQLVSPTRVLLSGLGADELCGGYARYRTAFHRGGDAAARASMKADVDRIWLRNLGRDDR